MAIHSMAPADAAWFHTDGPANPAIVTGVLLTRRALDFSAVRAVCQERLLGFSRFRQRVIERGFPVAVPSWEDCPDFDIDLHLHHIALAAPHDEEALRNLVCDIASTSLDHALPLWQVHVVDDVMGGSALIMRCHHCIADGTALMAVARKLFDVSPSPQDRLQDTPLMRALPKAETETLAGEALHLVMHPKEAIERASALVNGAATLAQELWRPDDPKSPIKGEFAQGKRVAWSAPIKIKDVKTIGALHGAKVNDVMVAILTGALRDYLGSHGVDVDHTTLRAMVPVDLRPLQHVGQLGNEFGLVLLDLPIATARPEQRLELTKTRMSALKHSSEALASQILLEILGRAPKAVEEYSNNLFGRKCSLVVTNVMGPREQLKLAGVPIDRVLAWAPHPGKQLGMAISIFSYRGAVSLTVVSDAHLLPDPQSITERFNEDFQSLLHKTAPHGTERTTRKGAAKKQRLPH